MNTNAIFSSSHLRFRNLSKTVFFLYMHAILAMAFSMICSVCKWIYFYFDIFSLLSGQTGPGRTMFEQADAIVNYWIYKFMPLYAASYTGGVCCVHVGEIFSAWFLSVSLHWKFNNFPSQRKNYFLHDVGKGTAKNSLVWPLASVRVTPTPPWVTEERELMDLIDETVLLLYTYVVHSSPFLLSSILCRYCSAIVNCSKNPSCDLYLSLVIRCSTFCCWLNHTEWDEAPLPASHRFTVYTPLRFRNSHIYNEECANTKPIGLPLFFLRSQLHFA